MKHASLFIVAIVAVVALAAIVVVPNDTLVGRANGQDVFYYGSLDYCERWGLYVTPWIEWCRRNKETQPLEPAPTPRCGSCSSSACQGAIVYAGCSGSGGYGVCVPKMDGLGSLSCTSGGSNCYCEGAEGYCGDGVCTKTGAQNECDTNCPDCSPAQCGAVCGNGVCEGSEDQWTCPSDCTSFP